jgi:tRNA modification GTPase
MDLLADSLAMVEAGIDFSDEGIEFLSAAEIAGRAETVRGQLEELLAGSVRLERLTHEPTIVLAGRANAGKSTLTNALAGRSRSIVSAEPGTTRDVLSVEIALPRGMARVFDIAGLESEGRETEAIRRQMHAQARRAMEEADVLVLLKEAGDERGDVELGRVPDLRVISKMDLSLPKAPGRGNELQVSAKTGQGMDVLKAELERFAFGTDSGGAELALTSRHVGAIEEAVSSLARAGNVRASLELVAAELRSALDSLGGILGVVTPDDVLGRIFSSFCVGK